MKNNSREGSVGQIYLRRQLCNPVSLSNPLALQIHVSGFLNNSQIAFPTLQSPQGHNLENQEDKIELCLYMGHSNFFSIFKSLPLSAILVGVGKTCSKKVKLFKS